jgi:hypothetical protein
MILVHIKRMGCARDVPAVTTPAPNRSNRPRRSRAPIFGRLKPDKVRCNLRLGRSQWLIARQFGAEKDLDLSAAICRIIDEWKAVRPTG